MHTCLQEYNRNTDHLTSNRIQAKKLAEWSFLANVQNILNKILNGRQFSSYIIYLFLNKILPITIINN